MLKRTLSGVIMAGIAAAVFALPGYADDQSKEKRGHSKERMAEKFKKADTNQDGNISLDEAKANLPRLAENFSKVDKNSDGQISKDEMRQHHKSKMKDCDETHKKGKRDKDKDRD